MKNFMHERMPNEYEVWETKRTLALRRKGEHVDVPLYFEQHRSTSWLRS